MAFNNNTVRLQQGLDSLVGAANTIPSAVERITDAYKTITSDYSRTIADHRQQLDVEHYKLVVGDALMMKSCRRAHIHACTLDAAYCIQQRTAVNSAGLPG